MATDKNQAGNGNNNNGKANLKVPYQYGYSLDGGSTWHNEPATSDVQAIILGQSRNSGKTWHSIASPLKLIGTPAPTPGPIPPTPTPTPNNIPRQQIAIINSCSVKTDAEIQQYTKDLQIQLDRDVAALWGISAQLVFVGLGQTPPKGAWWQVCLDDADGAGYLGYHDLTDDFDPIGKSFFATDLKYGYDPSVTLSHELLEMMIDPGITTVEMLELSNGRVRMYAKEIGDPCEADNDGYKINNTLVSDFVTLAWFQNFRKQGSTLFDKMGKIDKPFSLRPGGYLSYIDANSPNGWQQVDADRISDTEQNQGIKLKGQFVNATKTLDRNFDTFITVSSQRSKAYEYRKLPHIGTRRERRNRPRHEWLPSCVDFAEVKKFVRK